MESLIVIGARIAKSVGFEYCAAKVSEYFTTSYYNVVKLDDIIAAGKWIACKEPWRGNTKTHAELPENTVLQRRILYHLPKLLQLGLSTGTIQVIIDTQNITHRYSKSQARAQPSPQTY